LEKYLTPKRLGKVERSEECRKDSLKKVERTGEGRTEEGGTGGLKTRGNQGR